MVVDEDILEKEDLYILDRMKQFISTEAVSRFGAAKGLLILIERLVSLPSIEVISYSRPFVANWWWCYPENHGPTRPTTPTHLPESQSISQTP